jgi:hypothetical protein
MTTTHRDVLTEMERQRNVSRDRIREIGEEIAQCLQRKDPASGMSWTAGDDRHLYQLHCKEWYHEGRRDACNEAIHQLMKMEF